jgi:type I restriction enzyme R subunit
MYVDKPMRGHGLMQAIARVNRVSLEPDAARAFPNAEAVNSSLRALAQIIRKQRSTAVK